MKIFFGGSRKLTRLNETIKERVDNIISNGYLVLLGDANGADRAMQQYLAEKFYSHVLVFCAGNSCRNNVGNWETRFIPVDRAQKDFQYYSIRDKKMSMEADYGFMVWNGKSKGTLNNVLNLIEQNKPVVVYFSPQKKFSNIKSINDLTELLRLCEKEDLQVFEKSLFLNKRITPGQLRLSFA